MAGTAERDIPVRDHDPDAPIDHNGRLTCVFWTRHETLGIRLHRPVQPHPHDHHPLDPFTLSSRLPNTPLLPLRHSSGWACRQCQWHRPHLPKYFGVIPSPAHFMTKWGLHASTSSPSICAPLLSTFSPILPSWCSHSPWSPPCASTSAKRSASLPPSSPDRLWFPNTGTRHVYQSFHCPHLLVPFTYRPLLRIFIQVDVNDFFDHLNFNESRKIGHYICTHWVSAHEKTACPLAGAVPE